MSNVTAILFFTQTPATEASLKLVGGVAKKSQLKLQRQLYAHTLSTIQQSGLPYFVLTETKQQGNSFGQKLRHAFEAIFNKGFQQVIAVGNDCPQLTPALLRRAAAQLNDHSIVTGMDARGGLYLLGLQQTAFQQFPFTTIPWQTAEVQHYIGSLADCRAAGLPQLHDVHHLNHFKPWLGTGKIGLLHQLVKSLQSPIYFLSYSFHFILPSGIVTSKGLRAPPMAA